MKMKIEIRNDRAVVSGYVNAVGRDSRPITDVRGKFVEQIEPGAFRASLERSENVDLLLNHDKSKVYASTKDGSLKLTEDSIGLRAEAVLSDAEMIRKARSGEFRGWSFGMYVGDSAMEERAEGIPRRHVKSLNMFEVSLIDKSRIPCYVGTSVECRSDGEILAELRYSEEEPEIVEEERSEPEPVDYSAVDDVISELRYGAVDNVIAELRYNPYHDPSNGRFTSGGGSGGGFSNRVTVYVPNGQKGNKQYIVKGNDGSYYKYDNRSDVGEDYGIEIDLKYAQEMAHKFGSAKYGGTQKTRELFEKYNNEAKSLSAELAKLRKGRKGEMSMGGNLIWESSRAFDPIESKIEELRYNPYHDPSNGRFTSGGGGGGGVLVVEKGQKGKGYYVVPSSKFVASKATINVDPNAKMESSVNRLGNSSVEYNQVNNLQTPLTQDEIIAKISGGDMTKGSCSSLALAYIGNEAGYDVLDFRGGSSQDYFSRVSNIREMANSAGGVVFTGKNAIKSTFDTLNTNVVEGKTYYLAVGQHAAVVRKNGGKFEYLELQSKYSDINKFHELTPKTLHDRFSAKKSRTSHGYKLDQTGILIESGKLATNSDFGKILGYINTPAGKQQKGALGNVK